MVTRNVNIDALRGVAVILAVFNHIGALLPTWPMPYWATGTWTGVTLFFVISGYVISSSFIPLIDTQPHYRKLIIQEFYVRRLFRLSPLLLIWLLFVYIASQHLNRSESFPSTELFYQQLKPILLYYYNFYLAAGHPNPLGWHWSLTVEEQFYLFFPLFLCVVSRQPSRLLWMLILIAVVAVILRPLAVKAGHLEVPYIRFSTHLMIDSLLIGVVLSLTKPKWPRIPRLIWLPWLLSILIGIALPHVKAIAIIGYPIINLASALLVLYAATRNEHILGSLHYPMHWLGERSYGIYLAHVPIMWLIRELAHRWYPSTSPAIKVIFWIITLLLLCDVLHRYIEKPMISLSKRWLHQRHAGHDSTHTLNG